MACSAAAGRPLQGDVPPLVIVPNGVPMPAGMPERDAGHPIIGTLARIEHRKGIDVFLDACGAVARHEPRARFRIWGPDGTGGDAEFARSIHERVARLRAAGLDIEIGMVPNAAREIGGWSVFVLASRQDPFPLAVLEAMACGLPVVATRVGGVPDQIADGVDGVLVPAGDPGALAQAIVGILEDAPTASLMGSRARSSAAARSIEAQAAAMLDVYRQAAERRRGRR